MTPDRPRRLVLSGAVVTTTLMLVASVAPTGAADPTAGTKADWVTEDVAPGVVHIVNDGVRDLAGWGLATGRDGSVWLTSHSRYVPLGQREGIDWPDGKSSGVLFEVAPDGTVWVVEDVPDKPFVRVRSFDGDTWKTHRKVRADSLEGWALDVAADGTVWVAWPDQELRRRDRAWVVAHFEADGWHVLEAPYRGDQLVDLTVTDNGEVWITDLTRGLFRYDDEAWHAPMVDPDVSADGDIRIGPGSDTDRLNGAVGRDGSLWLVHCGVVDDPWEPAYECDTVLREQGDTWGAWSAPDELRAGFPSVSVAPDGSAWFGSAWPEDAAGLLHFDGLTWSRYLPHRSVLGQGVHFDTDGNTWVTSEPVYARSIRQVSTHVIEEVSR